MTRWFRIFWRMCFHSQRNPSRFQVCLRRTNTCVLCRLASVLMCMGTRVRMGFEEFHRSSKVFECSQRWIGFMVVVCSQRSTGFRVILLSAASMNRCCLVGKHLFLKTYPMDRIVHLEWRMIRFRIEVLTCCIAQRGSYCTSSLRSIDFIN